jgi:superfamily II DNA or RNA helicase
MNSWRKHQRELHTIGELMRYTPTITRIVGDITPGGGKSALPVILAHTLIPSRIEKIGWITPRDNLRTQGEDTFRDRRFRSISGHNLEIRATLPEADPSRGTSGFITTYQSVVSDKYRLLAGDFARHRYGLVLDECQHVAVGSEYERALRPLVERAGVILFMSGGLIRSDNKQVAFLPYLPESDGKSFVDLSDTHECRVIRYSLRDALEEQAIIPMWFELLDGNASWECRGKEFRAEKISEVDNGEIGSAIYTTLRTDFAFHLLQKTVEHWMAHRNHNQRARLLVVAPSQSLAQKYLGWLRRMGVNADIAISDESQLAKDNIRRLKTGKLDALVTVQMAYEGMDVPPITHIACLTHIRARPWIEQMLARATRYDQGAGPWEHQRAWIFAPDDKLFQEVMKEMAEIQESFVKATLPSVGPGGGGGADPITPLKSGVESTRATGLNPAESIGATEHRSYEDAMKVAGLYGLATEHQAKRFFDALINRQKNGGGGVQPEVPSELTVSQREEELKRKIESWINSNFYRNGNRDLLKQINKAIVKRYGKSRTLMIERELQRVWDERAEWSRQFLGVVT